MQSDADRLTNIEARLSRIEELLSEKSRAAKASVENAASAATTPARPWQAPPQEKIQAKPNAQAKTEFATKASSGNLLGVIGILCFVLAAVYVVKLAIDSGWLTPARQVALAGMFGCLMVGVGFFFRDKDNEYFSYLPAGGVVVLFLSVLGASSYHHLIGSQLALFICVGIAAACLLLYRTFLHSIYQVIATVGVFASPFLLNANQDFQFTNIYFIIASLTFSTMAVWLDARPITLLSAYLAIASTSLTGVASEHWLEKASFIFFHFAIYAFGVVMHSITQRRPLERTEALGFLPLILFFYALEYHYISQVYAELAPYFSLGLAALLMAVYFVARVGLGSERALGSGDVLFSSALLIALHSTYFVLCPEDVRPLLFLVLAGLGYFAFVRIDKSWSVLSGIFQFVLFGLFAWNFFAIVIAILGETSARWAVYGGLYAAALFALAIVGNEAVKSRIPTEVILLAAHAMAILSLYDFAKDWGSLQVSIVWLVYALAVLGVGYTRRDSAFAKSSVIVLLVAAGKALTWDMANANALVRILCLALTGALLYYSGWILRKIAGWSA